MPLHDFRLLTLGMLRFRGGDGTPAADALRKQRRKLAVLAHLAIERSPVPRDVLTDMFWGDQEEGRARHSLSEALSHLRRVLGPQSITARGTEVELAADAPLSVDALELRAAVAAERWSDAVRLYDGPFLDGVHPGGSGRLESWIEGERRALEQLFVRACERAYGKHRAATEWEEAQDVARKWLAADPLSEAAGMALLAALEAPDTDEASARALQAYQALRLRLAKEFGTVPGPRLQARAAVLAERLPPAPPAGTEPAGAGAPPTVASSTATRLLPPATPARTSALAPGQVGVVAYGVVFPGPAGSAPGERGAVAIENAPETGGSRRRLQPRVLLLAGGLAVATLAFSAWLAFRPPQGPEAAAARIAVLPFSVRGPAEFAYLREGVVDLLSANLEGAGAYRTVDPQVVLKAASDAGGTEPPELANRLAAGHFVRGDVVVAGGRMRMSAGIYRREPDGRRTAEAIVEGPLDSLFLLVDRLAAQLLAASGSPMPPLGRLAALTTTSLPALKLYLEGESDYRRGLYASAFEAFRRAADLDTTFALAHYRVAQAANWALQPGWGWDSIVMRSRRAAALAPRLAPRPRLLVEAYAAWMSGAYDDAERDFRAVVRTYPDEVEAWYGLAEVLFHTNPVRGRSTVEAAPPFERVLALEPENIATLSHLLRVSLREGRTGCADSLLNKLERLVGPPQTAEFHALRAFSHGSEAERARAVAELRAIGNDELTRTTAHRVALYARSLEGARRLLPLLLAPGLPADVRAHAHVWLAELEIAHGRWRAADQQLALAATLDPVLATEQRALLAALPFAPASSARPAAAEAALQRLDASTVLPTTYSWLAVYNGHHPAIREYVLGLLALRRGDTTATRQQATLLAARAARSAALETREFARGLGESLRAHLAAAQGRRTEALTRFDAGRLHVSEGLLESQFGSQAYERWARAEQLVQLGRPRAALPWYATLPEMFINSLVYLAPAELRQAEIYERLREDSAAIAHYRRFVELWSDADPELRPQVEQARRRLQALAAKRP